MANKKKLLTLIITLSICITLGGFGVIYFKSLPTPSERLSLEKELYVRVLRELSLGDTFPLAEYTTLGFYGPLDADYEWIHSEVRSINRGTYSNFIKVNQQPIAMRDFLPPEMSNKMVGQSDWQVIVSRIGFDILLTQALVFRERSYRCSPETGCCDSEGLLYFFQKAENRWVLKERILISRGECNA